MARLVLLCVLAACGSAGPEAPQSVAALDLDAGPLVLDEASHVVVSGDLQEGEKVVLLRAGATGNGPCLPQAGGLCVDLVPPLRAHEAVVGADGSARFELTVPGGYGVDRPVVFQAVLLRGELGGASTVSPAITTFPSLW